MKKLRHAVQKIDDLRNEEEQGSFAEVAYNTDDSKSHPRQIAKGITHENLRWIP